MSTVICENFVYILRNIKHRLHKLVKIKIGMNNKLIEKIISCSDEILPEFTYSNPLLDKNVTKALSKSFVKLLNISKDNGNENNTLRHTVLENIRKVCKIEPEGHAKVNEDITEFLTSFYEKQIESTTDFQNVDVDKQLDVFLVRRWKETNLKSSFGSIVNPEIAQALLNLDDKIEFQSALVEDIIHWDQYDRKYLTVLKDIWCRSNTNDSSFDDNTKKATTLFDDTSIKFKPEIEKLLLEISQYVLEEDNVNVDNVILSNDNFITLLKCCAVSPMCFQMCISILNCIFIKTNLHLQIQKIISLFILNVKEGCKVTISVLYPTHLSHLVTLLDINLEEMPISLRQIYIVNTQKYLKILCEKSETDLIMLLSHYPQWYSIYFE